MRLLRFLLRVVLDWRSKYAQGSRDRVHCDSLHDTAVQAQSPASAASAEVISEKDWLATVLDEYRTLRMETADSLRNQHQVLVYAWAVIGLLIAGASQVWANLALTLFIFLLALPALAYLFVLVWLGEVNRMMRAGYYFLGIERKVEEFFTTRVPGKNLPPPLGWERWLRGADVPSGRQQMTRNYVAVIALFLGTGVGSALVGVLAMLTRSEEIPDKFLGIDFWLDLPMVPRLYSVGLLLVVMNVVGFGCVFYWVKSTATRFRDL